MYAPWKSTGLRAPRSNWVSTMLNCEQVPACGDIAAVAVIARAKWMTMPLRWDARPARRGVN